MQLGDLVSVYGSGPPQGRGAASAPRGGRGGRGRGFHHRGGHRGSSSWIPPPPPLAASQQPFVFGVSPSVASAAPHEQGGPTAAALMMPPPAPLIVQPSMASHHYQRPKSSAPRPPKQKGKYACETCDKFFETEALLKTHTDDHVQCEHAGCPFKALPKVVSAHSVVHTRALPSLNTPEEIARYRAERRKNFPTDANVRRKQEEEAEKRKRGEIPEVAQNKRGRRGRGGANFIAHRDAAPRSAPATAKAVAAVVVPPALAALSAYADSSDEAPEETSAKVPPPAPEAPLEDGEIKNADNSNKKKRRCTFFIRGNCRKGANCPFSHEPLPPRSKSQSLLQRVLERDIRREYSAALQCLRYIVQNNFLQS